MSFLVCTAAGAQQMMSLGNLQFVLPNADAAMQSRTIRLKMAGADIASYYQLVGGIAFTQQAVPSFNIESIGISYSEVDRTSRVSINGNEIVIPLEMYELQPIVNFADSDDNVAMTMYGNRYGFLNGMLCYDILFHPAFIDNLMGLHLLHVDAMVPLDGTNGEFPIYDDSWCITDSEFQEYTEINSKLLKDGTNYFDYAEAAYKEIMSVTSEEFSSYIYTDFEQPIHFSVTDGEIIFDGLPYYQFADSKTDETSLYRSMKLYADILSGSQYELSDDETDFVNYIYSVDNQPDKTEEEKAEEFIRNLEEESGDPDATEEILSALFTLWVSEDEITEELRTKPELPRSLNPVVYGEVDKICQWTALFRYIKEKNPSSWNKFVDVISQCDPDAENVITPISIASNPLSNFINSLYDYYYF